MVTSNYGCDGDLTTSGRPGDGNATHIPTAAVTMDEGDKGGAAGE